MAIFKGFRRNKSPDAETKEEKLSLEQLVDFLGIRGTKNDALSEATYFACLRILSEAMGKLPLHILQHNEQNGTTKARWHPLYDVLHSRPNPYMTAATFWSTMEQNRHHYGNAYALIHGAGEKLTLWILESSKVRIINDDEDLFGGGRGKLYYVYSGKDGLYPFMNEEIIHLKTSRTFDGITGISVRDQLRMTIGGNVKAQKMLNRLYETGFTAKAVLQYTSELSDEKKKLFAKLIEDYALGKVTEVKSIIPLPLGTSLTPLTMKLADEDFIEIKKYSALQIASAFGVKAHQINDLTKTSYASTEAQQLSFYVDTLLYPIKQSEEELEYKLLSDEESKKAHLRPNFNVSVILRADLKTQITMLSKAVNSFLYTPNEAREYLNLEALPGGDKLLGNGASIPVEQAGQQYGNVKNREGGDEEHDPDDYQE